MARGFAATTHPQSWPRAVPGHEEGTGLALPTRPLVQRYFTAQPQGSATTVSHWRATAIIGHMSTAPASVNRWPWTAAQAAGWGAGQNWH